MHNGLIREFPRLRRELVLALDDSLFASIEGTTDSETMFDLALTFGLESDPVARSSEWSASSRRPDAGAAWSIRSR
jgi:predicted glutamine amidotransferase